MDALLATQATNPVNYGFQQLVDSNVFSLQDNHHTSPKTYSGSKTISIQVSNVFRLQDNQHTSSKTYSGPKIISIPVPRCIQAPGLSAYQSQDVFSLQDNHHTSPKKCSGSKSITIPVPRHIQVKNNQHRSPKTYSDSKTITIPIPRCIQAPRQSPYQSQDVFSLQDNQHTSLKASTQTVLRTTQMARRRLSRMNKQRATQKAAKETKTTLQSLCPISYEKIFTPERIQSLSTINPLYHEFTLQKKVCQNYSGK
ncbi:hypothetical protein CHS0354_013827 [Potamilus streckersoni]|uniref:Uncharacterized protein n=1 Tax=Potamilus streckersoni TaxID=2493646 RepID=A0AAE0SH64_9BIVA|nr:hypothetical protein CHS0354_013827 [Potamilus streckersoni]